MYFLSLSFSFFFFNDTATTEIYTLSLHDALPILSARGGTHREEHRALQCSPATRSASRGWQQRSARAAAWRLAARRVRRRIRRADRPGGRDRRPSAHARAPTGGHPGPRTAAAAVRPGAGAPGRGRGGGWGVP